MSHISILSILIATVAYLMIYVLCFSNKLLGSIFGIQKLLGKSESNPLSPDKLIVVLIAGLITSFFMALFMLMGERSGMADGIKTGFMLTIIIFGLPLLVIMRSAEMTWSQYFLICTYGLLSHTFTGALIGLMG